MAYFIPLHSTCYSRVDLGEGRINERNISRQKVKIEGLKHMLQNASHNTYRKNNSEVTFGYGHKDFPDPKRPKRLVD